MIETLDRVALWVGRVILDGIAVSILITVWVLALEFRDWLRKRKGQKEAEELERMYGGSAR